MNNKTKKEDAGVDTNTQANSIVVKPKSKSGNSLDKIDLLPRNYTLSDMCPRGSLLKLKKSLDETMHVKEEIFEVIQKGTVVLALHSLENRINRSHVLTFLYEEKIYMYVSVNLLEDFEILSKGTIVQDHDPSRQITDG